MIDEQYIAQLHKGFPKYLSNVIDGLPFQIIHLKGGKDKPQTTPELHKAIASFLKYEQTNDHLGWVIEWEEWQSRKLGSQRWPSAITITSEEDYLHLLNKQQEVAHFKQVLQKLFGWNANIASWLSSKPHKVLELQEQWKGICAVVDYLLQHNVQRFYIRSLPVPVHTKFIQQYKGTILSLLKHFDPVRFPKTETDLESALGLQVKSCFNSIRWLDTSLAKEYTSGIEVLAVCPDSLQEVNWKVKEVWLVENETNLYLLPNRRDALAIFSKGYALHQFVNIPFFLQSDLFYWGDLDEDGFIMLHKFRQHYPRLQSVLMDEQTVKIHISEIDTVPFRFKGIKLDLLPAEAAAFKILQDCNGRIEQEKLQQAYMLQYLHKIG